jgi:hypothetical protein
MAFDVLFNGIKAILGSIRKNGGKLIHEDRGSNPNQCNILLKFQKTCLLL